MKFLPFLLLLSLLIRLPARAFASEEKAFTVGYGEKAIPADLTDGSTYYVAGYRNDHPATGILDDQYAKAVYIEDAEGRSVLLICVDCVGLSGTEAAAIRAALSSLSSESGCKDIHIISTHDHAGADTLGLWGKEGCDGKNLAFSEKVRLAAVEAARSAYASRSRGSLYFGSYDTSGSGIQEDTRLPIVFDPNLYSFRFEPEDPSFPGIRIVNFASHAESLDGDNSLISADFPAYAAKYVYENSKSRMVWIPGAIGGLIRTRFLLRDRVANCLETGRLIGEMILSVENERKLEPSLSVTTQEFSVPCENPLYVLLSSLGVLSERTHAVLNKVYIDTEMSFLQIGDVPILLVPGELFPELAYGDKTGFIPNDPDAALPPLTSVFGDDLLIFCLADDEIGYIPAPDNYMLSSKNPYLSRTMDKNGEDHYEETNSAGPGTARCLYEAALKLKERIK